MAIQIKMKKGTEKPIPLGSVKVQLIIRIGEWKRLEWKDQGRERWKTRL